MYIYIHMYICMYVCMHICIYVCKHTHIYIDQRTGRAVYKENRRQRAFKVKTTRKSGEWDSRIIDNMHNRMNSIRGRLFRRQMDGLSNPLTTKAGCSGINWTDTVPPWIASDQLKIIQLPNISLSGSPYRYESRDSFFRSCDVWFGYRWYLHWIYGVSLCIYNYEKRMIFRGKVGRKYLWNKNAFAYEVLFSRKISLKISYIHVY